LTPSTFTNPWKIVKSLTMTCMDRLQDLSPDDWSGYGIACRTTVLTDLTRLLYGPGMEVEYFKMALNHLSISVENTTETMLEFGALKDTAHALMCIFSTKETASQKIDALYHGLLVQQELAQTILEATRQSFARDTDDAWHNAIRRLLRNLNDVEWALPKPLIDECLNGLKIAQDRAQADREVQGTQEAVMLPAPAAPWTSNEGTNARGGASGRGRGRKPENGKPSSERKKTTASRTPTAQGAPPPLDEAMSARGGTSGRGRKRKSMSPGSSTTAPVQMSAEQQQGNHTRSGRRTRQPARYSSS